VLVMNGEIYNHAGLRRELESAGEVLRTGGDAEVLAVLLARWGVAGLAKVEGSYAFAFLGGPRGPLLLGRDPLGVRPLVGALRPQAIVFASTLDALLATGAIRPRVDAHAIADVLRDGVVSGGRTALRGIRRVRPGQVLAVETDLSVGSRAIPPPGDDEDDEPRVLDALRHAVHDRLPPRRPAGVFLSGGIDSALVAALARERGDVTAYTLTFPGRGAIDEARRAQRTARRLGLVHVEVPCPRDPTMWVHRTVEAFDEPFADASAVCTWGLALAAGRHVRVALSGTGGDEVFGGYRRYWLLGTGPWLRHVPDFLREPVSAVLERSLPSGARVLRASGDPEGLYRGLLRLQPLGEACDLFGPRLAAAGELARDPGARTAFEAMADDLARYLPDDLLVKEDRALMAHGIEGRHPFLDARVRRAARAVEVRGSVGRGRQKQLLRAFVRDVIDPDLARSPKRGFAFPVDDLYRGPLRPLVEDLVLSRTFRERGLVTTAGALRTLREHVRGGRNLGATLHAIVMVELWARRVLDRAPRTSPHR
ncbi:MAG: asparagine synthetase B, partial [Planctomycetota bacterium]